MRLKFYWECRMQVVKPKLVVKSINVVAMQLFANSESNQISKAGCRWLSKANWKQLAEINLSKY